MKIEPSQQILIAFLTPFLYFAAPWTPVIQDVVMADGTVYITVDPLFPNAYTHKLCLGFNVGCAGHVEQVEIRPFDEHDQPLEQFIMRREPVTIPPLALTTSSPTAVTDSLESSHKDADAAVAAQILGSVMALLLIAGLVLFILWHKGYWRKVHLLRCCGHQAVGGGQPMKVMQLYVSENPQFISFVRTHMHFLQQIIDVDSLDCSVARGFSNPDDWMKSMLATHHVLIYLSPTLGEHLKRILRHGDFEDLERLENTHLNLCGKAVQHLRRNAERRKFSCGGTSAVFVLSGCFSTDREQELSLNKAFGFPSFWVMKDDLMSQLESPLKLVRELSGGCKGVYLTRLHATDWPSTTQAHQLRHAAVELKAHSDEVGLHVEFDAVSNGSLANGHYYQPLRVNMDGQDRHLEMDTVFTGDVMDVHDHFDAHPGGNGGGRGGPKYPHRTDSGFSSATTDPRDRNSDGSSDANSPDGFSPDREEPSERDTLIVYPSNFSLHFVQPEDITSELGSQSNIVEKLRCLNEKSDQHWHA
ncbi:hypothetical protein BaRGS_00038359 [Batillaria attramentaria]|uniref:Uncharacterized protein n=1 Tax=Batillaria attramentaria TaxID=370345 RepID=A0ABD0J5X4_9CAEN